MLCVPYARADGLRAADRDPARHARDPRRRPAHLFFTPSGVGNHDDLAHARHGAGIAFISTATDTLPCRRDVDADPVQRRDLLSQHRAIGLGVGKTAQFSRWRSWKARMRWAAIWQRLALRRGKPFRAACNWLAKYRRPPFPPRRHADAVETVRVFQYGGIAARFHVGQDFCDRRFNRCIGARLERQQGVERLLETILA